MPPIKVRRRQAVVSDTPNVDPLAAPMVEETLDEAIDEALEETIDSADLMPGDEIEEIVAEPDQPIVEELLPEHVRVEREAGRAAVAASEGRFAAEIEAGRKALEEAAARAAARK